MSELGDDFRQMREQARKHKAANSVLCWRCGCRVWKEEAECSQCGAPNDAHEPKKR